MNAQVTTLTNGIRVASDTMSGIDSIFVGVWVDVGARKETVENNGIAHFLEHMSFKGTAELNAKQIAESIESRGASCNASTGYSHTTYYIRCLKEDLSFSVDMLANILTNSTFVVEELEKERSVILQEIGKYEDTPEDIIWDRLQEASYKDQALGRSILGTKETINNISQRDMFDFVSKHYYGKNILVIASGNVVHEDVVECVEKSSLMGVPKEVHTKKLLPASFIGGEYREQRATEQLHIAFSFPSPHLLDDDHYTMNVLNFILGSGMSSRLFQEVREKRGLVYSVGSAVNGTFDCAMQVFYAGTSPNASDELIDVMSKTILSMQDEIKQEELAKARKKSRASLLMALERPQYRASRIANDLMLYNKIRSQQEVLDKINAVDDNDIRTLSKKVYSSPMSLAVIGDVKRLPKYQTILKKFVSKAN